MLKKILVIINPKSGVNRNKKIETYLTKHLIPSAFDIEIYYTQAPFDGQRYVSEQKDSNLSAVLVVGGYGTINEVGNELVNTNISLGIIPMGSGNGLARYLDIPMDIEKAVKRFSAFQMKKIDVGRVNNHYFFCSMGFGIDAIVSKKFANSENRGFLNYAKLTAKEVTNPKKIDIEVNTTGSFQKIEAVFYSIMNINQFGNGFVVAPDANTFDGQLDIVKIKDISYPHLGIWFMKSLKGIPFKHKDVSYSKVSNLEIINHQKFLHIDGDYKEITGKLNISVIEKGLKVIC